MTHIGQEPLFHRTQILGLLFGFKQLFTEEITTCYIGKHQINQHRSDNNKQYHDNDDTRHTALHIGYQQRIIGFYFCYFGCFHRAQYSTYAVNVIIGIANKTQLTISQRNTPRPMILIDIFYRLGDGPFQTIPLR